MADWTSIVTTAVLGLWGWFAFFRTYRSEKTAIVFALQPGETEQYSDPEEGSLFTCYVDITLTNRGKTPVTIKECECRYAIRTSGRSSSGVASEKVDRMLGLADARTVRVCLYSKKVSLPKPEIIAVEVLARDSTNHEWRPSRKSRRQFRKSMQSIWPVAHSN